MEDSNGGEVPKEGADAPPAQAPSPNSVLKDPSSPSDISMGPFDFKQADERIHAARLQLEGSPGGEPVSNLSKKSEEAAPTAGKALMEEPAISVPKIPAQDWRDIFEATGLCQAYDLESQLPTPAGTPLFLVNTSESGKEKPVFVIDDRRRTVKETTYTERHRFLVEKGFSSADLSIKVPYVNASVKADKEEKQQSELASKDVFYTERDEFPRCQIDIGATVRSNYLQISPMFLEEVESVTVADVEEYKQLRNKVKGLKHALLELWAQKKELKDVKETYGDLVTKQLEAKTERMESTRMSGGPSKLDADLPSQRGQPALEQKALHNSAKQSGAVAPGGRLRKSRSKKGDWPHVPNLSEEAAAYVGEIQAALKQSVEDLKPARKKVVLQMQDVIKRFGAVWVESITLGAQKTSTKTQKETWDQKVTELSKKKGASLAGDYLGAQAGGGVATERSEKRGSDSTDYKRTTSVHASGGDTLIFKDDDAAAWERSIRATQNWRITSYRKLRLLSDLPGLDAMKCKKEPSVTFKELLEERLNAVVEDVYETEFKKDPPRRRIGNNLVEDLLGYWYGFQCERGSGNFHPAPDILRFKINKAKVVGSHGSYQRVQIAGVGEKGQDRFGMGGFVTKVVSRQAEGPLEPLGTLCFHVEEGPGQNKSLEERLNQCDEEFVGHLDWTGMHGAWTREASFEDKDDDDPIIGTWTLVPVKWLPINALGEYWTFLEREVHINEPQRRWIFDPVVVPSGARAGKRLDPKLLLGAWQGYHLKKDGATSVPEPLREKLDKSATIREVAKASMDSSDDEKTEAKFVANVVKLQTIDMAPYKPSFFRLDIEVCEALGGPYGRQRFKVTGKAREGAARYKVHGCFQQVSPGSSEGVADDFPYLAKVELTLVSLARTFKSSTMSCIGHLDHMGIQGIIVPGDKTEDAKIEEDTFAPTFALMPVKAGTNLNA